jgi:hypothetical protein
MIDQATRTAICERIADGDSLRAACKDHGFSHTRFLQLVAADKALADHYTRAVLVRADVKFEELDEVSERACTAETAVQVQGYRLKADNIKWQLARMNSKKYGDKLDHSVGGDADRPIVFQVQRFTQVLDMPHTTGSVPVLENTGLDQVSH